MAETPESSSVEPAPQAVVGQAIQDLTATRLGRGFIPLGLLALLGIVQMVTQGAREPGALLLTIGAPLSALAMLGYGLRVVQRAFGRPNRVWMTLAMAASLAPPAFGVYVLAWRGLRAASLGVGAADIGLAILFVAMGVWVLRTWSRMLEVERLARVMAANMHEYGGSA